MNNVEFQEFKEKNGYGTATKYVKSKERLNNTKCELFTLIDWKNESESYIEKYIWDIGKGKFMTTKQLNKNN